MKNKKIQILEFGTCCILAPFSGVDLENWKRKMFAILYIIIIRVGSSKHNQFKGNKTHQKWMKNKNSI
jgi:hypothetical protein